MTSTVGRHAVADQTDLPRRPRHAAIPLSAMPQPGGRGPTPPLWSTPPPAPMPLAGLAPIPHALVAPTAPAPRPGMRWSWLAVGVVLAVLAVGVLVSFADAHRTMTVRGTVTISGMSGLVYPGSSCYSTTWQGTPVSVYDASGALVGTSSLPRTGTARNTWSTYSGYADSCEFPFTASDVSSSSDYYRIAVGSGQGQGVSFSRAQLESGTVAVTLR